MDLSPLYKAIAGGAVTAVVAELAHFGFQPNASTVTALGVIVTAVVGYVIGHVVVYFAPRNKV
jgi:hypothetical protein